MKLILSIVAALSFVPTSYGTEVPEIPNYCHISCIAMDNNQNLYAGESISLNGLCRKNIAFLNALKKCEDTTLDSSLCFKIPNSCKE